MRFILLPISLFLLATSCYNFNNPAEFDIQDNDSDDNSEFDGTFENYSLGTAGRDAGFNVQLPNPGPASVMVSGASETNQYLGVVDGSAAGYVRAFRNFAGVESGSFQVGFSLRVPDRGAGPEIEISGDGGVAVRLFVETDGNLEYMTPGGAQATGLEIEENSFYAVLITGDLTNERFTLTVDGTPQATNVEFLESANAVRRLTLTTEHSGTGVFYIDDIVFDHP